MTEMIPTTPDNAALIAALKDATNAGQDSIAQALAIGILKGTELAKASTPPPAPVVQPRARVSPGEIILYTGAFCCVGAIAIGILVTVAFCVLCLAVFGVISLKTAQHFLAEIQKKQEAS